jgi:hypothetical protein
VEEKDEGRGNGGGGVVPPLWRTEGSEIVECEDEREEDAMESDGNGDVAAAAAGYCCCGHNISEVDDGL